MNLRAWTVLFAEASQKFAVWADGFFLTFFVNNGPENNSWIFMLSHLD